MVDMQQDARAAMYMMTREIRMAGYDPQYNSGATIRTANDEAIAFDSDENRNGAIDTDERFYYALNNGNGNLERGRWDDLGNLKPVALNIDALNFVYLDNDGNTTSDLPSIRSVQITLVARSGDDVPVLMRKHTDNTIYTNQQGTVILPAQNDNFRRIRLTATVKVRNLGL
jgi:type IV pilus assembly protein PilW